MVGPPGFGVPELNSGIRKRSERKGKSGCYIARGMELPNGTEKSYPHPGRCTIICTDGKKPLAYCLDSKKTIDGSRSN